MKKLKATLLVIALMNVILAFLFGMFVYKYYRDWASEAIRPEIRAHTNERVLRIVCLGMLPLMAFTMAFTSVTLCWVRQKLKLYDKPTV